MHVFDEHFLLSLSTSLNKRNKVHQNIRLCARGNKSRLSLNFDVNKSLNLKYVI